LKDIKASITLSLVIIISAILLVAGMTLAFVGIDLARTSSSFNDHVIVETYLYSCFDEGMYLINKDKSFTGEVSIQLDQGNCSAVVSNESPNRKTLNISSQENEYYADREFVIDVTNKPYSIVSIN